MLCGQKALVSATINRILESFEGEIVMSLKSFVEMDEMAL